MENNNIQILKNICPPPPTIPRYKIPIPIKTKTRSDYTESARFLIRGQRLLEGSTAKTLPPEIQKDFIKGAIQFFQKAGEESVNTDPKKRIFKKAMLALANIINGKVSDTTVQEALTEMVKQGKEANKEVLDAISKQALHAIA